MVRVTDNQPPHHMVLNKQVPASNYTATDLDNITQFEFNCGAPVSHIPLPQPCVQVNVLLSKGAVLVRRR